MRTDDTSDERDTEYEAEELRLTKEDEERRKAAISSCPRKCCESFKNKLRLLDASRGLIVAVVLMTCVFVVAVVFANRYWVIETQHQPQNTSPRKPCNRKHALKPNTL